MKSKIDNELFLASATPIIYGYDYGCLAVEDSVDFFLVKPVIGKPLIGKKKVLGYVEVVSNKKVCDTMESFNANYMVFEQINYDSTGANVYWNIKYNANDILKKEAIEEYLKQDKKDIEERIDYTRNYCKSLVKEKKLTK